MADPRPHLLFISENLPYPPISGGRIVAWELLKVYSRYFEVRLLSFCEVSEKTEAIPRPLLEVASAGVELVPIKLVASRHRLHHALLLLRGIFTRIPMRIRKFSSVDMRARVGASLRNRRPSLIHCNDIMTLQYAPSDLPIVLVRHNDDSELSRRRAGNAWGLLRWLLMREANNLRQWEENLSAPELVLALSAKEAETLRERAPGRAFEVFPVPVAVRGLRPLTSQPIVLSIGTLSWPGVSEGLLWFAEQWTRVRANVPDARWIVAGKDPGPQLRALERLPGVEVLGFVEDLPTLIRSARVAVVPLPFGAGIRIKLLELFAYGCPTVATRAGADGLMVESGRELLIADERTAFADAVTDLLRDDLLAARLRAAAQAYVEANHDPNRVAAWYRRTLEASLGVKLQDSSADHA